MKDHKTFFIIVAASVFIIFAISAIYFFRGQSQVSQEQQELNTVDIGDVDQELESIERDLKEL